MITGVTITGADDGVDPNDLAALSAEFPFVEWGILGSIKRAGEPRYPSQEWIGKLITADWPDSRRLAVHLCGRSAERFMRCDASLALTMPEFGRVQINGWARFDVADVSVKFLSARPGRLILQCQSAEDLQEIAANAAELGNADVLFDPSGGTGKLAYNYPPAPVGCHLGFAGGIGPDNVLDVIESIGKRDPYWIDMESGVRDQHDAFSLGRVRLVLDHVAGLMRRTEATS